jgi:APA family basic amino acid/polyamine antiporter
MKLFPLLPIFFMAAYLFVGVSISIADPTAALTGLGVLAAFIGIYFIIRRKQTS